MAGEIDPKAAEDLAKSVQAIKVSTEGATRAFEDQLRIITQMRDVMAQMAGNLDGMTGTAPSGLLTPDGWAQVSKSIKSTTENTSKAATVMEKLGKIMKSPVTSAAIVMAGAFTGLTQGFKNLFALGKGIGSVLGSIADTAFSVGRAIVSIPFKMLDGLIGMAQKGGDNSYAVALEEVRDQFGSLKSESSKAVLGIAHNMDKMNQTGVSATSIFGNMAERVKAVNELAKGMGSTFQVFQKEIEKNGVAIMMYQRGLGLTDEQMGAIGSTAMRMGKGVAEVQNDMAKQAIGMSKAFGLNAKVLSKDMGKAMADLAHFGHLSSKEMGVAAAYAQKLGVSIDKLTGIMDATSTFDQASEGMSKLNETFGTNIDATKMMMAQTGQEKIEMLRKEFAKTGKSLESMNMQERMLIKQSAGMSDEMLNAALSSKNAGVSLDKLNKQGDKNEKKTMSQAEAMHELADSIKKIPQAGASGGTFLDHIINGFSRGVQSSGVFMKLMRNIQQSLREATMFGVRMGKMFVDLFPGVKDIFGGLGDIFNPSRFRKMFGEIMKVFDVFRAGGTGKMEDFMSRIKEVFLNFFNTQEGPGQKVLGGFKKFGEAVAIIFGKMSEWVILKLADIVTGITEWLKNPKIPNITGGISDGVKKPFSDALTALTEKLMPAFEAFSSVLWTKLKDAILNSKAGQAAMGVALVAVLGPMLIGTVGAMATAGIFKGVGKSLVGGATAGGGIMGGLDKATSAAANISNSAVPAATASKEALSAAIPEKATTEKLTEASNKQTDWEKQKSYLIGLAGIYAVVGGVFASVLKIVKGVPVGDIVAATLVTAALSMFLIPMAAAAETLSKLGKIDFNQVKTTLQSIAGMMLIGLVAFGVAVFAVNRLKISAGDVAVATLLMAAVEGMILGAALVLKASKLCPDPASASTGLIAIGAVLVAMGVVAVATVGLVALAGVDKVNAAVKLLDAIGSIFLTASAVVVIAGALGLTIGASMGIGGAAITIGLIAIGAVIAAMGTAVIAIIASLNTVPMGADIGTKTKAFADVMQSISGFAGQISNILSGMDLSGGDSASNVKRMSLVNDMIKTLIDGSDGKGGIKGIIDSVIAGAKDIKPEQVPMISALGNVLTAAGSMISSMMGKLNDVQKEAKSWSSFSNSENSVTAMSSTTNFVGATMTGLQSLITGISNALKNVENPEAFMKVAGVIGPILQAAGSMIASITPNVEKFTKETSGSMSFTKNFKNTGIDAEGLKGMATAVSDIMKAMAESLPTLMKSLMGGVGDAISKLDEKQLKTLPVIGDIIKSIAAIIDAVSKASAGSTGSASNASSASQAVSSMSASIPSISQIMFELSAEIPRLVKNLIGVIDTMPKGIETKVKTLSGIFDSLGKIISVVGGLPSSVKEVPGMGPANSALISMTVLSAILGGMLFNWNDGNAHTLENIFDHIDKIMNIKGATTAEKKASALTTIFNGLGKLTEAVNKPLDAVKDPNTSLKHLAALDATLYGMLSNPMDKKHPTFQYLVGHLEELVAIDKAGNVTVNAMKLKYIFDNLAALTTAIEPIANMKTPDMSTAIGTNLGFISKALNAENAQTPMASIVASAVILSDSAHTLSKDTATKITTSLGVLSDCAKDINQKITGMPTIVDGFKNFGTSFNAIKDVKLDAKGVLQAVVDMVTLTRQFDSSLNTLPDLKLPAKLKSIAGGMGLGGKFAYTVDGKDVSVHIDLNVSMDVGTVENVILSRKGSILRDRINYAIKHAAQTDAKKDNAYIRPTQGANGTPVASDVGN